MSMLTGRWGFCNASCLARVGVKRREVECRDRITELLSDDCNPERRPIDTRRCYHRRQCANDKSGNCTRQKESVIKENSWSCEFICKNFCCSFLLSSFFNEYLESFHGSLTMLHDAHDELISSQYFTIYFFKNIYIFIFFLCFLILLLPHNCIYLRMKMFVLIF